MGEFQVLDFRILFVLVLWRFEFGGTLNPKP